MQLAQLKNAQEKGISNKFLNWFYKAFKENADTLDLNAEYDLDLSLEENKKLFAEKFSSLFCAEYKEEINLKNAKEVEQAQKELMISEIKKEEQKLIENWKKSDYQDIDIKSFDTPRHFIRMLCKGITNSVILVSEGGLGKSYLTINEIKKEKKDFVYQNTYSSPLELYKLLYWNRDKIIIFDDVKGLFEEKAIAILKACLWETDGKRIATMNTIDRVMEDVPKIFEFKGQIIILANKINLNDVHISALVSRSNYFELNFTYKEKLRIMGEITKKPYKKTDIQLRKKALDLIIKNTDITTEDLNFRTLIKTYDLLLYDEKKAENLLKATIKIDEEVKLVMDLMKSNNSVNEQIAEFRLKTGKSLATYHRLKHRIKEMLK